MKYSADKYLHRVKELEAKNANLKTLLEAFAEFNADIQLKIVLEKALNLICCIVKAEAGTLWLLDEDDESISVKVANGPTADKMMNIKLKYGEGIVGRAVSTNKSELTRDVTQDKHWAGRVDSESGFTTRSIITVPLRTRTAVIGAVQLVNKQGDLFFNEEDVQFAELLANNASLAINNSRMYDDIQRFSVSVVRALTLALDARDPYTAGHSGRVCRYSLWVGKKFGINESQCRELERSALMHDVGKIAVPDHVLNKPDKLSDEEFDIMKEHPATAVKMLSKIEPKRFMVNALKTARSHHEKFNGAGYPDHLKGEEIPFYSRIVAVADAFDAMTSDRPYRKKMTYRQAAEELIRCKGSHFDPDVVNKFIEVLKERDLLKDEGEGQDK